MSLLCSSVITDNFCLFFRFLLPLTKTLSCKLKEGTHLTNLTYCFSCKYILKYLRLEDNKKSKSTQI